MAVATIVATVGGASSNSYCTQAEATQYQDNRPDNFGATWSGATSDEKDEALLFATVLIEGLFEWNGWPVDDTQVLSWPRNGLTDRNGYTIASTTIPQELKNAQAELARQLIASDLAANSDIETQGIRSLKVGSIYLQFGSGVTAKPMPDAVVWLIPRDWYLRIRGRASGERVLERA